MTHLGERVSALLDGQLGAEATERAMAHLARCRDCRDAVEIERLTKTRLACLAGPEPADELVGRLLAMGGPSGPLPPRPGYVPGSPRPKVVPLASPLPARATALRSRVLREVVRRDLVRVTPVRPPVRRPATGPGRSVQHRRARLAGAVLGALGVVGAGVGGLILTTPTATAGGAGAGQDSLTIQRPTATSSILQGRGPRFVPAQAPTIAVVFQPDR